MEKVNDFKVVGSYALIKRIGEDTNYGKDVYLGLCKISKAKIDFTDTRVLYFKDDVKGQIIIDEIEYDVILYYNIICNLVERSKNEKPAGHVGVPTIHGEYSNPVNEFERLHTI